jgi:hypothetical protein
VASDQIAGRLVDQCMTATDIQKHLRSLGDAEAATAAAR